MGRRRPSRRRIRRLLIGAGLSGLALCGPGCGGAERYGTDRAWWAQPADPPQAEPPYPGVVRSSHYLTMRDGVRLAIDLSLPEDLPAGERIPAILLQTRYGRSLSYRWPASLFMGGRFDETVEYLVRRGYAWIAVDTRGSGASFGTRPYPYSEDELRDGAEIVDWITNQPWSDGQVGAWGNSYTGGSALLLLTNKHPAVKAVMPRFTMFDAYAEAIFPGGLHLSWLTDTWGRLAAALDANDLAAFFGERIDLVVAGLRPTDDPHAQTMLAAAVRAHRDNGDIRRLVDGLTFRDDQAEDGSGLNADTISPHTRIQAINEAGARLYVVGGWYDSAFVQSAVHLFLNLDDPRTRLTIGPWDHGGWQNISPFAAERSIRFERDAEIARFFDQALKGRDTGLAHEPRVHYYTMGLERWQAADTWPPPGSHPLPLYLGGGARLQTEAPAATDGRDTYRVDFTTTTGPHSRWNSLVNLERRPVEYPDRREADQALLVYTSPPLAEALEVTGHPVVRLHVSADQPDAAVFVYLEDVWPDGRVQYVTEGQLRAIHRKLSQDPPAYRTPIPYRTYTRADGAALIPGQPAELVFGLYPTSYQFKPGHAIRLALAGADRGHFAQVTDQPPRLEVLRDRTHPSRIDLPIPAGARAIHFAAPGGREEER